MLHIIDVVDDDNNRGTRECGVLQIIVMAVFAVPVCCESGSIYFSLEHVWVDLS